MGRLKNPATYVAGSPRSPGVGRLKNPATYVAGSPRVAGGLWNGGDLWTEVSAHLPPIYAVKFVG